MNIYEFGERLIETRDLDPVYVGLHGAALPRDQLYRWLTAYWMFYHVGVASWLSEKEGDEYWKMLENAAVNWPDCEYPAPTKDGRWPRAAERRHFRGAVCMEAVRWFARNPPEHYVGLLLDARDQRTVMNRVQFWPLHGPWISFKAADMLERVVGVPLTFEEDIGLVYKEPRAALDILAETNGTDAGYEWRRAREYFFRFNAPPGGDPPRPCGVQEVETVLCKWKSHQKSHYPVGKDIREVRHALVGWGTTAEKILEHMPKEVV